MLFLLSLLASSAVACVTTARTGGEVGGKAVLKVFDRPPNLPPTPAPTPPPPPPPFQVGWVPAPKGGPVNQMTRQNCVKSADFVAVERADGTIDRDLTQEQFIYTCKYQMYIEVDLFSTQGRTGCACGLSWGRQTPPQDPNYEPSWATRIDKFSLQVYHIDRQVPLEVIPEFADLNPNTAATDTLHTQLNSALTTALREKDTNGNVRNFAQAQTVFTGYVNESLGAAGFDPQMNELLKDDARNDRHVPVMCFEVVDVYKTAYRWPEPPEPVMSSPPNAFVTNCVPFVPSEFEGAVPASGTARKRWHDFANPLYRGASYWIRDFLLFAVQSSAGVSNAWSPKSRYLTAYYASSDCNALAGVVTFDRQFSTASLTRNPSIFGGFNWRRSYQADGYSVIGGVPQSVIQNRYARVGFHSIAWRENFAREMTSGSGGKFRGKILFHMLNGSYTNVDFTGAPTAVDLFDGLPLGWEYRPENKSQSASVAVPHRYKLCESVPPSWANCAAAASEAEAKSGANACPYTSDRYLESVYYWHVPADGSLSCAEQGAFQRCTNNENTDTTYLAFQNQGTGALSRDFSKKSGSILLTGPRELFCQDITATTVQAFDPLLYKPISATQELKKRSASGDQFLSAEAVKSVPQHLEFKRQVAQYDVKPSTPLFGAPDQESIIANAAGGTFEIDSNTAGGSHPIALFDETYTVPLSLDPDDPDYDGAQDGYLFDNSFSACLQGTKGCNCRDRVNRRSCDAPLMCNSEFYCVDPPCVAGEAGCECLAGNTCSDSNLKCNEKTSTCVFDDLCPLGKTGCRCKPGASSDPCDVAADTCVEGMCLTLDCPPGLPGCECNTDAEVGPSCFVVSSTCSSDNVCVGGTVQGVSVTSLNMLGGDCTTDANCAGSDGATCNQAIGGVCTAPRCTAGETGCRCDNGACSNALDKCDATSNLCLTDSCEFGGKGCMCQAGYSCEAGFQCVDTTTDQLRLTRLAVDFAGERTDRCVTARCPVGENGCSCESECFGRGFECKLMDKVTGAKRCVATGRECGRQAARCVAYCGMGNVVRCPGCSDQVPICKVISPSSTLLAPAALLVLLAAVLVELW